MKSFNKILIALLFFFNGTAFAEDSLQGLNLFEDLGLGGQDEILEVDDAFQLTTENTGNRFTARWTIAEGHYLYRDKSTVLVEDAAVTPGTLQLDAGEKKTTRYSIKPCTFFITVQKPACRSNIPMMGTKKSFSRSSIRAVQKLLVFVTRHRHVLSR